MKTKSGSRRRVLLESYSEDVEEKANDQQASQPTNMKEKALPSQDYDNDMQLEDVSPEHGGNSLQLSTSRDEYTATPHQAAIPMSRLDAINLADRTPLTSIHNAKTTDT